MTVSAQPARSSAPAQRLKALGLRPNRRLSQSFLCAPNVARAMVQAAEIEPGDLVLEIGPGLGVLTEALVNTGARVVAVELDPALARALPEALGSPENLDIRQGDALALDLSQVVAEPYLAVASLPYQGATRILFKLVLERPRPTRVVVMLQEEVARRVAPRDGVGTYLGMALSMRARARLVRRVPPGAFHPVPRVRSAVVRLDLLPHPAVEVDSEEGFRSFLRGGFAQPRQQVHNSLAQGLDVEARAMRALALAAGIDSSRRPGQLSLMEWAALYREASTMLAAGAFSEWPGPT